MLGLAELSSELASNVRIGALFGSDGPRDADEITRDALALTAIESMGNLPATALTVGNLRRLELAKAIATSPRLLLADEPCAGLNATET